MATTAHRRNRGDDSVYFDAANNCWAGAVSLGFTPDGKRRIRRKVTGRTKTQVKDKLRALHRELDAGIHSSASYTMALCLALADASAVYNWPPTSRDGRI